MINAFKWWWGLVLAFGLLAVARLFLPLPFLNEVIIFSIYTMGCNFLLGRLNFISFGQPAYLAAGAYSTAFYLVYFGTNPFLGIVFGVLGGIVVSFIVGMLFVRLRGDYFAMVNLALAAIFFYLTEKTLVSITNGDNGLWFLTNMTSTPVLDITSPGDFYTFALISGFLIWAFLKFLDSSLYGACCLGTKINEDKVRFLGYDSYRIRLSAFVLANTITAFAGTLYAIYFGFVSPEVTSLHRVADPVVVTLLGGVGTLYGPIVGALAYTGLKDILSEVVGNWELIIGFLLVFIMLVGEKGIWGTLEPLLEKLFTPRKTAAHNAARDVQS